MIVVCTAECCACRNSTIIGEYKNSKDVLSEWQDFGIFASATVPSTACGGEQSPSRAPLLLFDDTTSCRPHGHEDGGTIIQLISPAERPKEFQSNNDDSTPCQQLRHSGSSTVSLSEEEEKGSAAKAAALRGGGSNTQPTAQQLVNNSQVNNILINKQISDFLIQEANDIRYEEEYSVHPHPLTNDILSRIVSTPFDSAEMITCYKQNNNETTANTPSVTTVIPPLSILPQKKFAEYSTKKKLCADVTNVISTFLIDEVAKITPHEEETLLLQQNNNDIASSSNSGTSNNHQAASTIILDMSSSNFGAMCDDTVVFLGYKMDSYQCTAELKPGDVIVSINGTNLEGLPCNTALQILQSLKSHAFLKFENRESYKNSRDTHPKTVADAQNQYDAAYQMSIKLQNERQLAQLQAKNVRKPTQPKCIRKLTQHFAVSEELRTLAWNNLALKKRHQETIDKQRQQIAVEMTAKKAEAAKKKRQQKAVELAAKRRKIIPVATASDVIKISHRDVSKLPVAFGFHIDDKLSKSLATAAATKWRNGGKKAAKSVYIAKITPNSKQQGIPESHQHNPSSNASSTPRGSANLLWEGPLGEEFPGWTKKTFERATGASARSKDSYFYSPHNQIKFRAMKGVRLFIGILSEPGVAGDESVALKIYKERGHKI
jgi:hypothetical protein